MRLPMIEEVHERFIGDFWGSLKFEDVWGSLRDMWELME
jgi:hypothetical protein